ncbi:hypothetical protein [Entomobacter blattae]|uniref:Uncharacterized protein n=1 Tax=Entomobacter blattae TaxID=2762277 RepID=A0A7H1NRF4_9PROT|nr:hypothetical protein [Entomobacter blattae]QNT78364.1 hypothetical protein JGUZn3_11370 [Entomobacter blattae]
MLMANQQHAQIDIILVMQEEPSDLYRARRWRIGFSPRVLITAEPKKALEGVRAGPVKPYILAGEQPIERALLRKCFLSVEVLFFLSWSYCYNGFRRVFRVKNLFKRVFALKEFLLYQANGRTYLLA